MARYSTQMVAQVWDDDCGERFELTEDADGLGMVELRYVSPDDKIGDRITMPIEVFRALVAKFDVVFPPGGEK